MNIWKILGIDKTDDKKIIKDAYTEKLKTTNPEDDAAGFMELRNAYEQALLEADGLVAEQASLQFDDTEVGRFVKKAFDIYNIFSKRIDEKEWDELLSDDVVYGLDTRDDAMYALLQMLSENHYLPSNIWKKIVDTFDMDERREELEEKIPNNFLMYIFNNAKYPDTVDYTLFEDETQEASKYDTFVALYIETLNSFRGEEPEKVRKLFEELDDLGLEHPDKELLRARVELENNEEAYAEQVVEDLMEEYPDYFPAMELMAGIYERQGRYEDAIELLRKQLEIRPDNLNTKVGIAVCHKDMGDYVNAKEEFKKLLNLNRFSDFLHAQMIECNNYLIPMYEEKKQNGGISYEEEVELGWCYYQCGRFDDAVKTLEEAGERDDIDGLERTYLYGRTLLQVGKYDEAIKKLLKWRQDFADKYRDVTGEKGDKNRDREGLTSFFLAECCEEKLDHEMALKYNQEGIACATIDMGMLYYQRGVIYNRMKQYEQALAALSEVFKYEEENFEAEAARGDAHYGLDEYMEALKHYEKAIYLNPYYAKPYAKQIGIMIGFEAFDEAENLLELFKQRCRDSDWALYMESELYKAEKKEEASKKLLIELKNRNSEEMHYCDIEDIWEMYHDLAVLEYETSGNENRLQNAAGWLDKALEVKPDDCDCLFFRGNICSESYEEGKAYEYLQKCVDAGGNPEYVYYCMANIASRAGNTSAREKYLKQVLEANPKHVDAIVDLGDIYIDRKKYDEAESRYREALMLKDELRAYRGLGCVMIDTGRYEDAITVLDKALLLDQDDDITIGLKAKSLLRLGRYSEADVYVKKLENMGSKTLKHLEADLKKAELKRNPLKRLFGKGSNKK